MLDKNLIKSELDYYENLYKNEDKSNEKFLKYIEVAKEVVNDKKSRIIRGEFLQHLLHKAIKS